MLRRTKAMADEKTDVQPSETADETETQLKDENQESQTVENTEEGGDDVKQEGDYYENELKRLKGIEDEKKKLEEDLAEKQRQLEIKNRALQAEKKKKPETTDRDSLKNEILTEMRVEAEVNRVAANKNERELLMHHYQNSIVRTGNVSDDIKRALAVANANRLAELLNKQAEEDAADDVSAASMASNGYGAPQGSSKMKSATRKEAEAILKSFKGFKPEMLKKLDTYLPR